MYTGLNFQKVDISFLFTSNRDIQKYHERFMGEKSPTDVITFVASKNVDIVISLDQALAQAKPRGLKLFHEVLLLMCHGLLHAKGFDDLTEKDWLEMKRQEFECMGRIL